MTRAPLVHRNLSATNRMARELVHQVESGLMTLDAPYQRESVWTIEQRRDLIKSWLLGVPLPAVIGNRRDNAGWIERNGRVADDEPWIAIIDGKQRLLTAKAWYDSEFVVPAWWFPAEYLGDPEVIAEMLADPSNETWTVRFCDLTSAGQRLFANRALIPYAEAALGSVEEEAEVYLLVNAAGTAQTEADLARAAAVAEARETRLYGLAVGDEVEVRHYKPGTHYEEGFRATVLEVVRAGDGRGPVSPNRNVLVRGLNGGAEGWYAWNAVNRIERAEG